MSFCQKPPRGWNHPVYHAALVAPRGDPTPLTPPCPLLPLPASALPPPPPVPLMLPAAPCPAPPIAWPERVLLTLHMAGMSEDTYEPLVLSFDSWAQREGPFSSSRPLAERLWWPSEFVGFRGTTESYLLGILRMNCGQLSPSPGSADANYVFAKGSLANGSGRNENNWHAQRICARRAARVRVGSLLGCLCSEFASFAKLLRRSGAGEDNRAASHGSVTKMAQGGVCFRRTPLSVRCS